MDMFPHTVTVYNVEITESPETMFKSQTVVHTTILRGVFLSAVKAVNVSKSGIVGADAVNLYIPFNVEAVDGKTGEPKAYIGPQEYWKLDDKAGCWTMSLDGDGGDSFFVKGEVVDDSDFTAMAHDGVYNITKIDTKDYGGNMGHWQVGGA